MILILFLSLLYCKHIRVDPPSHKKMETTMENSNLTEKQELRKGSPETKLLERIIRQRKYRDIYFNLTFPDRSNIGMNMIDEDFNICINLKSDSLI